jgi:hypothetical protein
MKWQGSLICLLLLSSAALADEPEEMPETPLAVPVPVPVGLSDGPVANYCPTLVPPSTTDDSDSGCLTGNHNFPNFIGYMSNPVQAIDPRATTEFWPIFLSTWLSPSSPLPSGNVTLPGGGLNVALSERLSMGINQGGYVLARFTDQSRQGWLNLGGWVQYTIFEDVPDQCLVTAGVRCEVPTGEAEVFQGHGPPYLAPYITAGKELGQFHVLGTFGYEFPVGPGDVTSKTFYGILHLDRQTFDWLYPLVEFNWGYTQLQGNRTIPLKRGLFNFTYETDRNIVYLAAGFNMVLVKEHLEFGAVYTTPISTTKGFDFDGMIVRLTIRY